MVSVLRSLGYRAYLKTVKTPTTYGPNRQAMVCPCWTVDYPAADDMISPFLMCDSPIPGYNQGRFCDRSIDREVDRARRLESSDRQAAAHLWAKIDRKLTLAAPWVVIWVMRSSQLFSPRAGNYTYCYLSAGTCLDQVWVR
jgi:hypothetical protein